MKGQLKVISLEVKDRKKIAGKSMLKIFFFFFPCRFNFNLTGTWQLTAKSGKAMNKVQSCFLNDSKQKKEMWKIDFYSFPSPLPLSCTRLGQTEPTMEGFEDWTVLHLPLINTLKSIVCLKETNDSVTWNQTLFTYPTARKRGCL